MPNTVEYSTWAGMRHRSRCPKSRLWKYYGGRGITVCKRWDVFANFLADMGLRPLNHTLERINNNRGYMPSNCRWATMREQAQNRRVRCSSPKGEEQGQSKLTNDKVRVIRALFKPCVPRNAEGSAYALAERFGIVRSTVYRVARGKSWRHI